MIGASSPVACGNKKCHVGLVITAGFFAAVMIVFSLPAAGQQGGKILVRVHTQSGESIPELEFESSMAAI